MIYDGLSGLIRIAIVGVLAYTGIIVILRISGCRTLSKMNAFDFVVTVALGSTLGTTLLSRDVALAEGKPRHGGSPVLSILVANSRAWVSPALDRGDEGRRPRRSGGAEPLPRPSQSPFLNSPPVSTSRKSQQVMARHVAWRRGCARPSRSWRRRPDVGSEFAAELVEQDLVLGHVARRQGSGEQTSIL